MPNTSIVACIVSEISAFIHMGRKTNRQRSSGRTDRRQTDTARSTRQVILIKNIYTVILIKNIYTYIYTYQWAAIFLKKKRKPKITFDPRHMQGKNTVFSFISFKYMVASTDLYILHYQNKYKINKYKKLILCCGTEVFKVHPQLMCQQLGFLPNGKQINWRNFNRCTKKLE